MSLQTVLEEQAFGYNPRTGEWEFGFVSVVEKVKLNGEEWTYTDVISGKTHTGFGALTLDSFLQGKVTRALFWRITGIRQ